MSLVVGGSTFENILPFRLREKKKQLTQFACKAENRREVGPFGLVAGG